MYVEIVTPEAILFKGKVNSITVPSIKGPFQILENHAPIIAVLERGEVRIKTSVEAEVLVENRFDKQGKDELVLLINSGTIEQKDNRVIILAE